MLYLCGRNCSTVTNHSTFGAVCVVIRDRFFMFYNTFLAQKYEKMQKNAKK